MIKKIITSTLIVLGLAGVLSLAALPNPHAAALDPKASVQKGIEGAGGDTSDKGTRLPKLIKNVVNILLYIIGAAAVIMIVIGGLRYVVSGGDSGGVTGAKNTILYAVVGLVVAILAYAIVNWVIDQF